MTISQILMEWSEVFVHQDNIWLSVVEVSDGRPMGAWCFCRFYEGQRGGSLRTAESVKGDMLTTCYLSGWLETSKATSLIYHHWGFRLSMNSWARIIHRCFMEKPLAHKPHLLASRAWLDIGATRFNAWQAVYRPWALLKLEKTLYIVATSAEYL